MRFEDFAFGSIRIDGITYQHDVVVDGGTVRKRKKGPSRPLRATYGHTPLSAGEEIPWDCAQLVIGTGAYGRLPVTPEVRQTAHDKGVELVLLPTAEAISLLESAGAHANAILHVTC